MSITADIVIAAVILLAVVLGAKSGLLQSLAGVIVLICSALGASWAAKTLADPLAQKLSPMLTEGLSEKLKNVGGSAASAEEMLRQFGFSGQTLENLAKQAVQRAGQTGQALADSVVGTVTHSISYAVVFLVAFVVLLVVLSLLIKPLELATKLPGLHALNAVGGAALGLVKGVLLVFFAVWALRKLQLVITPEMVEESVLLKFFAENSPLSLLTGL